MKRLLFVDDEPQILQAMKLKFYGRRKDWDMHFVGGGAAAIEALRQQPFDILVTDIRMPGIDGTALVAHALEESPQTIRIVLSGFADAEKSQRLISIAHRYLSKPCEPQRLAECIDRCLATHALIQSPDIRAKLGTVESLPPIPGTFAALQKALEQPTVDSKIVARIIQRDPAVSAKVLQVCNSAFFRLPRRISSLEQAVSYLGLSAVRCMALSAELFRPGDALSPSLDLDLLQRHALAVGAIARSLAAGLPWADDAFLAGLLHDIGFLFLGRHFKNEMQQALQAAAGGMALADAERSCIGIGHAAAGGYLLAIWGIPYEVVDSIVHHEAPQGTPGALDIASAVAIAHALLLAVAPQDVPVHEATSSTMDDAYLSELQVPHSWDSLVERTRDLLEAKEIL